MDATRALRAELKMEAATTRRVLERVPEDRLAWAPHEKSMTLGKLAWHLATIPRRIAAASESDRWDAVANPSAPQPSTTAAIVTEFDDGVARALEVLPRFDEAKMESPVRMVASGNAFFEGKRKIFLRTILMNHSIHHRGQLSVYLRLLGISVPSIYGPSADEKPASVVEGSRS